MFKSRTQRRKKKLIKKKYKKPEELSGSQLAIAFRRFRKNKAGLIGLALTTFIVLIALLADVLAPYGATYPMALEYHYTPWYQPPGIKEGPTFMSTYNRLFDGSFEFEGSFYWTRPPQWERVNVSEMAINSSGSGDYAVRDTLGGIELTQDISSSEKLYFNDLLFMVYLDGEEPTTLSVIFTYSDDTTDQFDFNIDSSYEWTYMGDEIEIIEPETISFVKAVGGSGVYLDNIQLRGGEYFANLHVLGTNRQSQDLFSKLLYGSRVSLIVSVGAIIIALMIGLPLGMIAGYTRGRVDELIMRITDIFMTLPFYFTMILVIVLLQQTQWIDNLIITLNLSAEVIIVSVTLGLGLFGWMGICRLVRATILQVREMDYVEAARALGASNKRIMIIHILPNILAPLIVAVTFLLAVNIVAEAGLAFLGYTDDSLASWGRELSEGFEIVIAAWWPVLFPALLIISAVMAFNLLGDGLRDAFDPRLR